MICERIEWVWVGSMKFLITIIILSMSMLSINDYFEIESWGVWKSWKHVLKMKELMIKWDGFDKSPMGLN